jgi:hypothetical protein
MIGVSYGAPYEFRARGKTIDQPLRPWKPEFVWNSLRQDDVYVEMTFLEVLDANGPGATREQAGRAFRDSRYRLWHANRAGRLNLRAGILPPHSGHPRYNPHADDIDFQIEADVFGLVAPGMPVAATEMCDVFGSIMNWGDGLYGGRFVAAMYAHAYREPEATPEAVRRCVDAGLGAIHPGSHYAAVIRDVLRAFEEEPEDWRHAWRIVEDKWGNVDLCPQGEGRPLNIDAKVNGAYIAIGMLYGAGDFTRTLEITTRCGQDADCNPANAAGVLGTILGYSRIPEQYTRTIPELSGHRFEHTAYDFPKLIEVCERVMRAVVEANGGRFTEIDGGKSVRILPQSPRPPGELQQMRFFSADERARWKAEFEERARAGEKR